MPSCKKHDDADVRLRFLKAMTEAAATAAQPQTEKPMMTKITNPPALDASKVPQGALTAAPAKATASAAPKTKKATSKPAKKAATKAPTKTAAKPKAAAARQDGVRPGSKLETIVKMLQSKNGCTSAEILAACSWPSVSVPQQARAAGLKLKKVKDGKVTRYYAA